MKNDINSNSNITFQGKVGSAPDGSFSLPGEKNTAEAGMDYAVSIAMIQLVYEHKLINDATYRNIVRRYGRKGGIDHEA